MSKTLTVSYEGKKFWAFDAALAVWLVELINLVEQKSLQNDPWWAKQITNWKTYSFISDLGFPLPNDWTQDQQETFLDLAREATTNLSQSKLLNGQEIAEYVVSVTNDNNEIKNEVTSAERYKSQEKVPVEPIVSLGEAITQLVEGTLPTAPQGTWWLFGSDAKPTTIEMRNS